LNYFKFERRSVGSGREFICVTRKKGNVDPQYNCSYINFNVRKKIPQTIITPADVTTSETGILLPVNALQQSENMDKKTLWRISVPRNLVTAFSS
jgi:hypothetical protein